MASYRLELVSPSSKEFDQVEAEVAKSCPSECIIKIERVIAPKLEERYQRRKEELRLKGEITECTVYHGSRDTEAVQLILEDGFKAKYSVTAAYGKGTYFATAYSYSKAFSGKRGEYNIMLICNIAIQKMVQGRGGAELASNEGDCWVNSPKKPTIYSIPNDNQSIPRYVVHFYENRNK